MISSLATIVRTVVGGIFLISAFAKAIDADYFANIMASYGVDILYYLAPAVIFSELLLGLSLIGGIGTKYVTTAGIAMILFFTAVYSYGLMFKNIEDCGCFGRISLFNHPVILYIRNILLSCCLIFVAWKREKKHVEMPILFMFFCMCVIFANAFMSGYTLKKTPVSSYRQPRFESVALSRHVLHNFVTTNPDSTYLVMVFSYTCPHCINSVGNLEQFKKFGIVDKIIGLCIDNPEAEKTFIKIFQPSFEIKNFSHTEIFKLTSEFPQSYFIKNDSIVNIISGELPSAYFLKNKD